MKSTPYILVCLATALTMGCACTRDITDDPGAKFGAVKNRPFATKKQMLVYGVMNPATGQEFYEISVAGETVEADMPIAIIPIGTVLVPVHATAEECESGGVTTYVRIEGGDFAGKIAKLRNSLFLLPVPYAYGPEPRVAEWQPDTKYLAPKNP